MDKKNINQQLLNKPIPVLPTGLDRLLQAFASEEHLNHQQLAKIISDFPSIAARLIFLANSAWAAPKIAIDNLETACARLGFPMVRNVSISLCIVSSFTALNRCPAFNIETYWCIALSVAEASAMLATCSNETEKPDTAALHTAGLLHNLGLLWLVNNWPEQASRALQNAAADESLSTCEALRQEIGADYCEAGGIIARSWKFPAPLVSAMEQHRYPVYLESANQSTQLVGYAVEMVSSLQREEQERPQLPEKMQPNFRPGCLDDIYGQLKHQFDHTRELARTMFSGC